MMARFTLISAAVGVLTVSTSLTQAQAPDPARVKEITGWMGEGSYSSTPSIKDRDFWAKVGASKSFASVVASGERVLQRSFQPLPSELYLEYSKSGNRTRYEQVFFDKLESFRTLVMAECVENKGRFLKPIQELIISYAADKSWVLPAHDSGLENFEGRQITIDLFASEVACELANADCILGSRLGPDTRAVVRQEAQRRIFDPYSKMVTTGKPGLGWLTVTNNWNAVCLANVTGTALALLEKAKEKAFYVAAAEKYIAHFLDGFTEDGYCSEGIGYWNYGYGCFVRLAHGLNGATAGKLDLLALPKARSAGLFARRMEITPGVYPAFADCSVGATPSREIMAYVSRHYDLAPAAWEQRGFSSARWLDEIGVFSFTLEESTPERKPEPPSQRDWFENAGIMICRGGTTGAGPMPLTLAPDTVSRKALAAGLGREDTARLHRRLAPCRSKQVALGAGLPVGVALKGGHNAEHHNHNDLGSYLYCVGEFMTLVDPGAEVYTRRTFSRDRYVSGVLNSFGHSVPQVAGQLQKTGRSATAGVLKLDLTDDQDTLQFDLTSAYPVKTLKQITRTFVFQRSTASLIVKDEVEFESPESFGTAIVTFDTWKQLAKDRLLVGEGAGAVQIQVEAGGLPVKIGATTIDEDVRGKKPPTRIGIDLADPAQKATIQLMIQPSKV